MTGVTPENTREPDRITVQAVFWRFLIKENFIFLLSFHFCVIFFGEIKKKNQPKKYDHPLSLIAGEVVTNGCSTT
jgi:hypothetical protein